jgi:hypothetical protein
MEQGRIGEGADSYESRMRAKTGAGFPKEIDTREIHQQRERDPDSSLCEERKPNERKKGKRDLWTVKILELDAGLLADGRLYLLSEDLRIIEFGGTALRNQTRSDREL